MLQEDQQLTLTPADYSLLTDLYELTMAACYVGEGLENRRASFELFVRRLPNGFGYLIAMGLAQALDYLEKLQFDESQIEALQATGLFEQVPERFWSVLKSGRFSGDVWAIPEGTAVFANEPLLRVEAPLWQAQLVETYILNTINYQTLIATRAARMRDVAGEDAKLLEFGTRRAFSPQSAIWAARAALAAGFDSTSNVVAALRLNQKPSGTMAHSLVMAIAAVSGSEDEAFSAFQRYFPSAPLLIDTYDTVAAAQRLAKQVKANQTKVAGVRLDSGDIADLSKQVNSLLPEAKIFASGDMDEWEIGKIKQAGGIIDGYGVGTRLVTGKPVNGVYKLVEMDGIPTMKQSSSKETYPGRKQVFRHCVEGKIIKDRLATASESPQEQEYSVLQLMVKEGKRLNPPEPLADIKKRTAATVAMIPDSIRQVDDPQPLQVDISDELKQLTQQTEKRLEQEAADV
ncbi:MAG: nicotinate phosphoribosyltransferase [Coleofasciculus sp. G3-WIS-01]|uniref:nicotinate phosphoribosyltransferase n=1 Tax=Coleofasciculus sp. G3-WIS-01 TaxID=3069528 RepID=UPI0032F93985